MNIPRGDTAFLEQTKALVTEVHAQRSTIEELHEHNATLKRQYEELAKRHSLALEEHDRETRAMRSKFERELHAAITAKDLAEQSASETGVILREAAERIMQGVRAMSREKPQPTDTADSAMPSVSYLR